MTVTGQKRTRLTSWWNPQRSAFACLALVCGCGVSNSNGSSGSSTPTSPTPVLTTVSVTFGSSTIGVGSSTTAAATGRDQNGATMTLGMVSWSSSAPSIASVSSAGQVTGVALGQATITATSGGKQGQAVVTVVSNTLAITSFSPSVLVEGATATINGSGFTSQPTVTIAGFTATVSTFSSTQISLKVPYRDCQPQRSEAVVVRVGSNTATSSVAVKGDDPLALAAGYFAWSGEDQCIQLAATSAGAKYLVGMLSMNSDAKSLVAARLSASATAATGVSLLSARQGLRAYDPFDIGVTQPRPAPAVAMQQPLTERAIKRSWEAEARLRDSERALLTPNNRRAAREWLASTAATPLRGLTGGALAAGDEISLKVQGAKPGCSAGTAVRAVVRYVGTSSIWLEDVANPTTAFTTAEYQSMDAFYGTTTKSVLTTYYGSFTDVDRNERTLILVTKEVNKQTGLLGFVWGGDLYPTTTCAASNVSEIFYGLAPDPNGVHGKVWTKTDVADQYRALMAHELTHVLQFGALIYGTADNKDTWEFEGGATLAEQLVGNKVYGYQSGQNLGLTQYSKDTEWYQSWVIDLARYFGYASSTSRTTGAPEQCSWTARPDDGNTSPCTNPARLVYGVPATLFRFALDRYGPTYAGGETALMRSFTSNKGVGLGSITTATGVNATELLVRFGLALWSDGKYGNPLTSWNIFDIWSGLLATTKLMPYTSTASLPSMDASVRAYSHAYLEWSPPAATPVTSLRMRTSTGGAVPSTMVLWIYRYQ